MNSLLRLFLPLIALDLCLWGSAQTLPEPPAPAASSSTEALADPPAPILAAPPAKPQRALGILDWSGIGAAATLRVLDYLSTEQALEHPDYCQEAQLPQALVASKPGFAAFQAATVVVNYGAYRFLAAHHLRPFARAAQLVYVGIMSRQVAANYQVLSQVP